MPSRFTVFWVGVCLCLWAGVGQLQAFPGQRYANPPPVPVAPGPGPDPTLHPVSPQPQPLPVKVAVQKYRYYPAVNVYADPLTGLYWAYGSSGWALGPLPASIALHRLGRPEVVWGETGRPWRRHPPR